MKNTFISHGLKFEICPYTPRNNEFERGLKYRLGYYAENITGEKSLYTTGYKFSTKHAVINWVNQNYWMFL